MTPLSTPATVIVGPFAEVMDQAKQRGVHVRRIAVATDVWKSFEADLAKLPRATGQLEGRLWGEFEIEHNHYLPDGYASVSGPAAPTEHDVHRMLFAARRLQGAKSTNTEGA